MPPQTPTPDPTTPPAPTPPAPAPETPLGPAAPQGVQTVPMNEGVVPAPPVDGAAPAAPAEAPKKKSKGVAIAAVAGALFIVALLAVVLLV